MYKNYQSELNKLTAYMKENSFELSLEKTCLMHFNNGENPKSLPQIKPWDGQLLNYKQNTVGGGGGGGGELEPTYWKGNH